MNSRNEFNRRRFLQLGAAGALAMHTSNLLQPFGLKGQGADGQDYRALVCVFLFGGADMFNLFVPRSASEYATYSASRGNLAEPLNSLLPVDSLGAGAAQYGFHGSTAELQQLYQAGDLALVANVGPLVRPLTKDEYLGNAVPVPQHLFSHSDQQVQWQTAHADGPGTTGWGGRMGDLMRALNGATALPPTISLGGSVPMLVGDQVSPYALGPDGPQRLELLGDEDPARRDLFAAMIGSRRHKLEEQVAKVHREAIEIERQLSSELANAQEFTPLFAGTGELGAQLNMVARLISIRANLGVKRQVFFVGQGGYDTHAGQAGQLPLLFRQLSQSLGAFQQALSQMGASQAVTTFTSSDFGRTLSSNGQGSDHGWGSHALVMGGAVQGQRIYGTMPNLTLGGPDEIGEGRLLPTLSVDQYAATLAKWMQLTPAQLGSVFPNLGNFGQQDLGFLA